MANFVNQHTKSDLKRNAKEVLARAKSLSSSDGSTLKTAVNQQAFSKFEQSHKPAPVSQDTSVRSDEAPLSKSNIFEKNWKTEFFH